MKTIVFIRHAQAENTLGKSGDFNRNLSKKGIKDAKFIAQQIKNTGIVPELIVASPALRTTMTAEILSSVFKYSVDDIHFERFLYESFDKTEIISLLENVFPEKNTVFVIGHNPLIAEMADVFTGKIHEYPSGKAVGIEFETNEWRNMLGKEIFAFQPE